MPEVMDWPQGEAFPLVTCARELLRQGRAVVLPTESTYVVVADALASGAVQALNQTVGEEVLLGLLLGHAAEVFDWLPGFRGVGLRLARRFWPGPLTVVSGAGLRQGLFPRLPQAVQNRLAPDLQLSLRLCDHPAPRKIAVQLGMPLLFAATPWITPDQVIDALGDKVGLIVQQGRSTFAQPDTMVEVRGRAWRVLSDGAIPLGEIEEAAPCRIVFVCTGNTCRSPLAEGLCRKLLADQLRCPPGELAKHGFLVQSAGLAAMMGAEATPEAAHAAGELGADLTGHGSKPLTIELLHQADRLFAMTANHLRMLYGVRGVTPRLLAPNGEDVADPIGAAPEVYRDCAKQIRSYLEKLLPELLEC
jgi:L-threonylcarbamoyladenylate synthase